MPHDIDLNADLGESYGAWRMGDDDAMFALVTSANVACGFHAGDPLTMRRSAHLAAAHGVALGAHPGYRDRAGFGRRALAVAADELAAEVVYQVGALAATARSAGVEVRYVKAHGALYHRLGADVLALHDALAATAPDGLVELVPAARTLLVSVDPGRLPLESASSWVRAEAARAAGSAGDSACGFHSAASVRPTRRQPPGLSRG